MHDDISSEIESVLFSSGRKMEVQELAKLTGHAESAVKKALHDLKKAYESKEHSSLILIEDGNLWKLTVKDKYSPLVSKVVQQTELSTSVLETLAVIAFKYPIYQSEVIKIRTNKAYDHLTELEEAGFISREKSGRTKKIKLNQKFFDYFDVPESKMKEAFSKFDAVEETIAEKENEAAELVLEKQRKEAAARNELEEERQKVGPLEIYDDVADQIGSSPTDIHDNELSVDLSKEKTKQGERKELEDALSQLSESRASETFEDAEELDIDNLKNGVGDDSKVEDGEVSKEADETESGEDGKLTPEEPEDTDHIDPFFDEEKKEDEDPDKVELWETDETSSEEVEEQKKTGDDDPDEKESEGKELFGSPDLDDDELKKKAKKSEDDLDEIYREVEKTKDELIGKINKGNLNPE